MTSFNHAIVDYDSGERRMRYAAHRVETNERAKAIASGTANGETKCLNDRDTVNDWKSDLRPETLKVLKTVGSTNLSILPPHTCSRRPRTFWTAGVMNC